MEKIKMLEIEFINSWIHLLEKTWILVGFLFGICLVLVWLTREMKVRSIFSGTSIILLVFQPGLYFSLPYISQSLVGQNVRLPEYHIWGFSLGCILGMIFLVLCIRYLSPIKERLFSSFTKTSVVERNRKTDIRQIQVHLPNNQKSYHPSDYFDQKKGIFLGLDEKKKPVYIGYEKWKRTHADIIGTTGCGKGVMAAVMLSQSIAAGESVVVLDPKNDEFLPHVLYQAAKENGTPYIYIDLLAGNAQWNPLQNKTSHEIEELFTAGFSLGEKGTDADFYRLDDRRAARVASTMVNSSSGLSSLLHSLIQQQPEICALGKKFVSDLEEISLVPAASGVVGVDIQSLLKKGAVIYVRGSMRNPKILKLQRMFVLSVMQFIESRNRESARHVCIFLDEFKYLISRQALEALGAIRDKRAHVVIAHQSLGDLKDCPSDLNPDSVVSSINENCSLKISYAVKDPDTADWLARMSGSILVDDETRQVRANVGLTEIRENGRSLRQAERNLVDTNMLQSLPERCAVLFGVGLARFFFTSPIAVKKMQAAITPMKFQSHHDAPNQKASGENDFHSAKTMAQSLLDV